MLLLGKFIGRQAFPGLAQPIHNTPGRAVTRYSSRFSTSSIRVSQRTKYINALIEENGPGASYRLEGGD